MGALAHILWGCFPLYFRLLDDADAVEIVFHRVLWSLLLCLVLVAVTRAWVPLPALVRRPDRLLHLGVAAGFLALNWGVYIYAVNSGQVVEASLGYFINPLVSIVFGVTLLSERLRVGQWIAVGIVVAAVGVLTVGHGRPPVIALTLALSFGLYGLLKKRAGKGIDALSGLTVETLLLSPVALAGVVHLALDGSGSFTPDDPALALCLSTTGVVTAVPLLLFAGAARRIPLSTLGLLQYLTPVLQFLCGTVLLHENMPVYRWAGFGLVWVALVVLALDGLRSSRRTGCGDGPGVDRTSPQREIVLDPDGAPTR
jgi:chloramphenicol-sensitive protein RarD